MNYGNNTLDFLSILSFYCNFGSRNMLAAVLRYMSLLMRLAASALLNNLLSRSRELSEHLKMTTIHEAPHIKLDGPSLTIKKSFFGHSLMTRILGLACISQLVTNLLKTTSLAVFSNAKSFKKT